jgi:hypothetical protein
MRSVRSLWTLIAGVASVAVAVGVAGAAPAPTPEEIRRGRPPLAEDLMKLSVVVMANQTPITQADARAVLPVLEDIQAQLREHRQAGERPDGAAVAGLEAELLEALSPELRSAVATVRLLQPAPPPGRRHQEGRPGKGRGGPRAYGEAPEEPPWGGGRLEGRRGGRRGHGYGDPEGEGMRGHGRGMRGHERGRGGRGMHGRGPGGPGGPRGLRLLGPLVDFFRETAAG